MFTVLFQVLIHGKQNLRSGGKTYLSTVIAWLEILLTTYLLDIGLEDFGDEPLKGANYSASTMCVSVTCLFLI